MKEKCFFLRSLFQICLINCVLYSSANGMFPPPESWPEAHQSILQPEGRPALLELLSLENRRLLNADHPHRELERGAQVVQERESLAYVALLRDTQGDSDRRSLVESSCMHELLVELLEAERAKCDQINRRLPIVRNSCKSLIKNLLAVTSVVGLLLHFWVKFTHPETGDSA